MAASENMKGIYAEATVQRVLFKKRVMRNFVGFARKHFPGSPSFIKLNSVDLQLI